MFCNTIKTVQLNVHKIMFDCFGYYFRGFCSIHFCIMLSIAIVDWHSLFNETKRGRKKIFFWRLIVCRGWWIWRLHNRNTYNNASVTRIIIQSKSKRDTYIVHHWYNNWKCNYCNHWTLCSREHLLPFILWIWYSNLTIELC